MELAYVAIRVGKPRLPESTRTVAIFLLDWLSIISSDSLLVKPVPVRLKLCGLPFNPCKIKLDSSRPDNYKRDGQSQKE